MSQVIMVTDAMRDVAGICTWWELSGNVHLMEMREAFDNLAWDHEELPAEPTIEMALSRAAAASLTSKRQLLRPLSKRGAWEIVLEKVVPETLTESGERLEYSRQLTGWVDRTGPIAKIVLIGDPELEAIVRSKMPLYERVLTTVDYSAWLLQRASRLHAIALRARGGFYFIPKDQVGYWRQVVEITKNCSGHSIFEIPAMRTEEAVESILTAVRDEASKAVEAIERIVVDPNLSTRGLNAIERSTESIRKKIEHYCDLLGRDMPEMEVRMTNLVGAIQSARVVVSSQKEAK